MKAEENRIVRLLRHPWQIVDMRDLFNWLCVYYAVGLIAIAEAAMFYNMSLALFVAANGLFAAVYIALTLRPSSPNLKSRPIAICNVNISGDIICSDVVKTIYTYTRSRFTCFICYSSKNQDFADKLYADLHNRGVPCWLATEDLKIGDLFSDVIDKAIRLRDKTLVILSKESLESEWVKDEVETAIDEGEKKGKQILLPIRTDDSIMESEKAWVSKLRQQCHIGDFTNWKDHDEYQKAFERLLRDLEAG